MTLVPGSVAGMLFVYLFDSGPVGISLPASSGAHVFQLAALDSTRSQMSTYGAAITLLLLDNAGGNMPILNSAIYNT